MKEFFDYALLDTGGYRLTVGMLTAAIIIIVIAKILVVAFKYVFGKRTKSFPENEERLYSILTLITYVIWVIAIALMLENLGVKITFLLAGSAALLVGLGLGLQQTFNDIVSGIIILVEGSLKKNDVVEVDKLVGRVKEINLRTSVIYTRDRIDMIVPNHKFINENVINWSHHSKATRFSVNVGVAYGSDELKVKDILHQCLNNHKSIIVDDDENYPRKVRIYNFGDSSIDFELLFWSRNIFTIENTKSDIRFEILKEFRENGIVIPFPQRDVHISTINHNNKE